MGRGRPKGHLREDITRLWELGYSDDEIAEETGVELRTVRNNKSIIGLSDGLHITKRWLQDSGIGAEWDKARMTVRKAAGWE